MSVFLRTIRFSIQHVWRNLWLSVVTLFLLILTTVSMTLVLGLNVVGQQVITAVEQKVEIDLYFYQYVPETDILAAQEFIRELPETQSIQYTSAAQALEEFTETHQNDPSILATLSELDENVLPPSVTIKAEEISDYPKILEALQGSRFQELINRTDYSDNSVLIQRIEELTRIANQSALAISSIFLLISIIVIFNTIRITIYNYREEIGIMKLVGATNSFIRLPFILEGAFLGALAALITVLLGYSVLILSDDAIRQFFEGYNFSLLAYVNTYWYYFVFGELFGAVLLSVTSSMIAITRYLKV